MRLDVSRHATLQMETVPSAGPQNMVSLYQVGGVALRGILESNWYARADAAAYFVASY